MRVIRRLGPATLVALLGTSAASASEHLARASDGSGLVVRPDRDGVRIERGATTIPVALPARSQVNAIERDGDGWLLAGSIGSAAGQELFLVRGDERGSRQLAPPPGRVASLRGQPVPFVGSAGFEGVAWLEGPESRKNEIRFSSFDGERFAAPEIVSPQGPGSQLALAGTRLADGRLLLIWAGFDGVDDEIWWSVRASAGAGWSRPARVADDNATPDITPALATEGQGALVAWSRFDGSEYRLMTARFDGTAMTAAAWAADPGTLFPSFERGASELALLYRNARHERWAVARVDRTGRLGRAAELELESVERPLVAIERGTVHWELGDRTASSALE